MKIIFMGTPDFASACLEKLIKDNYEISAVFSQPDKPVGRKQILTPPPVKTLAFNNNITVYQPKTLKDGEALDIIKKINPDIIVVVAYGKILPKEILTSAKYGCINVHASLLPKYRGAAPIQWAVLNGDKETGVTVMQMDEGLDTGDMLYVEKTQIGENETSEELFDRLAVIGADSLVKALDLIEKGKAVAEKQPSGDFGYAQKITKAMSEIDWNEPAQNVHNLVRGLQSWPCAQTKINGKTCKVHKTILSDKTSDKAGKIVDNKNVITVCCGDGKCVDITELQLEGKKRMNSADFLMGNKLTVGTVLGE